MNNEGIIKNIKEWLPKLRPHIKNKRVLDIGCGTGIGALFLSKACNAKFYLMDYEDLREKKAKRLPFKLASIEKIPFKDNEFDVGHMFFMLHHIDKKIPIQKALSEASRVCKKLIIIEEAQTKKTNFKRALETDKKVNAALHPNSKFTFNRYYTKIEIQRLLKDLGFKVESSMICKGREKYGNLDLYLHIASRD